MKMLLLAMLALATGAETTSRGLGRCTATILGKDATADGSTIVTQTADCYNCDFRLAKVVRQEVPHAVRRVKATYPMEVSNRSLTWSPANLDYATLDVDAKAAPFENDAMASAQRRAWTSDAWQADQIIGFLSEDELAGLSGKTARHYDSFENGYAISNAAGLIVAESTCEATQIGRPPRNCVDCEGPLFDVGALSKVAARVCATARCAIRVMGSLAEKYGFYGAVLTATEAGEALMLADGLEAWIFHVLPDTTGLSATWVAQRVPDDSVAVCANSFVIRGVPPSAAFDDDCLNEVVDDCEYLASKNLEQVAADQAEQAPDEKPVFREQGHLDFAKTFGPRSSNTGYPYSTHRVWRVMSLLAPNATKRRVLSRAADYLGSELPFAVPVEKKTSVHDVIDYQRDYFQNTNFDLSQGLAAGPWGDPTRYDGTWATDPTVVPALSHEVPANRSVLHAGRFERAISLFRTSYCIVAQSWTREDATVWFSQGTPHAGVFVPLRLDRGEVPLEFRRASLFQYDPASLFWVTQLIANWMRANVFVLAREDLRDAQRALESTFDDTQSDNAALAAAAHAAWTRLFAKLVAKYHDGFRLATTGSWQEPDVHRHFYPTKWLQRVGYFDPVPADAYYTDLTTLNKDGGLLHRLVASGGGVLVKLLAGLALLILGLGLGAAIERRRHQRSSSHKYIQIADENGNGLAHNGNRAS